MQTIWSKIRANEFSHAMYFTKHNGMNIYTDMMGWCEEETVNANTYTSAFLAALFILKYSINEWRDEDFFCRP